MSAKLILALAATLPFLTTTLDAADTPDLWKDPSQPIQARVKDFVSKMTLVEKSSQILANPPAIPRLGIPAYSHRNECLHGIANGVSTVFPQAIGMAATFDTPLIKAEADTIATEGRAKHNDYVAKHDGNTAEHNGLNFYSPNINIFRDPRWGRGQETYGEDPFLTAEMGVAFVTGLQGDDPAHPKTIACAKHFAVHSGPEKERHHINMTPPERDLYETYLPAFEALVKEAHVGSAMGAYSALNGKPCCANPWLLTDLLRKEWGFDGVVFSDGGAIGDIWAEHHFVKGPVEAAAAASNAGCDVSSGGMGAYKPLQPETLETPRGPGHENAGVKGGAAFTAVPEAVKKGLLSEQAVNTALTRELAMRFKLGLFDPPGTSPFDKIDITQNDTPEYRALALKVAQESMVLLKNDGILPLDKMKYRKIAVIGPNADDEKMQNGNYAGRSSKMVTILDGIKAAVGSDVQIVHEQGSRRTRRRDGSDPEKPEVAQKAIAAAKDADLVIFVSGIDAGLEHEEGPTRIDIYEGFSRGDRTRIELPQVQEDLIKQLHATGKPIILVNCSGSAMAIPWENQNLHAILQAWYPGEEGGTAVANVLFGNYNPAGRLPITFYASTKDLPDFTDYSMKNRTYKYFTGKPLYPFGFGLSYTTFDYADAKSELTSDSIKLSFTIKNAGPRDGDEIPQVYFRHTTSKVDQPNLALCAFKRIHLNKGEAQNLTLEIPIQRFRHWDETKKQYAIEPGAYELAHRLLQRGCKAHHPGDPSNKSPAQPTLPSFKIFQRPQLPNLITFYSNRPIPQSPPIRPSTTILPPNGPTLVQGRAFALTIFTIHRATKRRQPMWNLSSLATSSPTTPNASFIEPLESRQLLSAGPSLRLYNLDILPSNQRMVFNRIENLDPKVPNVVHDQATLRLKNAGSKTLHITSLKIKGPWKIISAVPHSIRAHHSRNVTLQFTATTPPTFSVNQTNGDINPTLGGAYTGSLTIRSNDKSHPKKVEQLAGWFQNQSENTEEPSLQTLLNTIAGFTTQIAPTNTNNLLETSGKTMYGEEINSPYWSAANSKSPVIVQEFASWHTQGNPVNLSWYPKGTTSTQTLFVTAGNEAQTFLPHQQNNAAALAAGKFSPATQSFGFKIDYEWSDDSRNTTGGGDGHHIRFYPVRDSAGNVVPNSYFMVLDYSVPGASVTAENYDFQDAVYILSNIRPATA